MRVNLLSYQIYKRYDTKLFFHLFIFMYEESELFICSLLHLNVETS